MKLRSWISLLSFTGLFCGSPAAAQRVTAVPVSASGFPGSCSVAMVQGRPAIAWTTGARSPQSVRYVRAMNAGGTAWGAPVDVDTAASMGNDVSLRTVNGNPAVCYVDNESQRVKFVRSIDATGSAWDTPVSIASIGTNTGLSMEIINGNPAIAARSDSALLFFRSTDVSGTVWTHQLVPGQGQTSLRGDVSLKEVQGRPAIAFATTANELRYVRAQDAPGSLWLVPVRLGTAASCLFCSMEIISGHPAVSFSNQTGSAEDLMYVRSADPDGTAWNAPVALDTLLKSGIRSSLSVVNGSPSIAFSPGPFSDRNLRFVQARDATGDTAEAWKPPAIVDSTAVESPVLLEADGSPVITYIDIRESAIGVLRAPVAGGPLWPADLRVQERAGFVLKQGASIGFGTVAIGGKGLLDLTLTNPLGSSVGLNFLNVTLSGPDAAEFSVTVPPVTPLAGGASTVLTVQYAPVAPGEKTATLHITTDAVNGGDTRDIILSGNSVTGIVVERSDGTPLDDGNSYDFPHTAAGGIRDFVFTVWNNGGAELNSLALTIDGPDSSEFSIAAAPAPVVPPGATTAFTIRHQPVITGFKTATLHLANNVSGSRNPYDVTLRLVPQAPDLSFAPHSLEGSLVMGMAVQGDGSILAAAFEIIKLKPSGQPDTAFFAPSFSDLGAHWVAMEKDGGVLAGGSFSDVNGQPRRGLLRLLPDGTVTSAFPPDLNPPRITCAAVQPDGKIVAAGKLEAPGTYQLPVVRFHADGSPDAAFTPSANGTVVSLALQSDGKILLAGDLTKLNGETISRVGRLNADGTLDESFHGNFDGPVRCLAVQPDGRIFAGGDFSGRIARLLPDGTRDPAMTVTCDGRVFDMALQADGKCIVSGEFTHCGTAARQFLARIQPDGSLDPAFVPMPGGKSVGRVILQADGRVLFTGVLPDFLTDTIRSSSNKLVRLNNDPAFTSWQTTGNSTVRWLRGGSAPEVRDVTFDLKTEDASGWTRLGAATRIPGGWELSGLTLPVTGALRAQAYAGGSLIESTRLLPGPLEAWRRQYFNTTDNTGDAADDADPDNDGLTNFTEFAFGLNPLDRSSSALPEFSRNGTSFTVAFPRPPGREEVGYRAEWSPSLLPGTWTNIPNTGTGDSYVFTAPGTAERLFVRFRLSSAQPDP